MVGGVRIEIAGRLVGQQHPRRIGDRAGDRDALLFAAGQFGRTMGDAIAKPEIAEDFLGARHGLGPFQAADHLRQHHVFQRREFRQQPVRLIDKADVGAADLGAFGIAQPGGGGAADIDLALVGMFEQPGDMQQRRFARARRRHQRHRLPGPQRQLGAAQNGQHRLALHILPLDVVQINDRHLFGDFLHRHAHS